MLMVSEEMKKVVRKNNDLKDRVHVVKVLKRKRREEKRYCMVNFHNLHYIKILCSATFHGWGARKTLLYSIYLVLFIYLFIGLT